MVDTDCAPPSARNTCTRPSATFISASGTNSHNASACPRKRLSARAGKILSSIDGPLGGAEWRRKRSSIPRRGARACAGSPAGARTSRLQLRLDRQVLQVPSERRRRHQLARAEIADRAIVRGRAAIEAHLIPAVAVADVTQVQAIVMGPEERHVGEGLRGAEQVRRRGLALALCMHPMLDT